MKRLSLTILAVFLALPVLAQNLTKARLLFSAESAKPGETIWAGLDLELDPAYRHTYWRFPGLGLPPTVAWTLPAGLEAGPINWPVPEKSETKTETASFFSYVYEDRVVLLVPIKLATDLRPGPVTISAAFTWLQCADKGQCVPSKATVSNTLTVGPDDKTSANAALIQRWLSRLPLTNAPVQVTAQWDNASSGDTRAVIIDWQTSLKSPDFYPYESNTAAVQGATENLPAGAGHARFRKIVQKGEGNWPDHLSGILVGRNGAQPATAVEVNLPLAKPAPPKGSGSLAFVLLSAFVAGLILNVMPCVLPVIALKVLGFVNQSKAAPGRVRRLGLIYGAGVLVSFLVLAGLAVAAQKTGEVAGWGDAFRNPHVQLIMTILMTLIALNLFGVFEITLGAGVMGSAAGLASRQGYGGAFFNGVLATALATPCTAPYLGAAVTFTVGQPPGLTTLVFLTIGLGLAFPFVLLCWEPRLLKALPAPGAWMEKFKMAMGFPMLATAAWLVWVTARNQQDMLWLELFLVVLALASWIWGAFVQRGARLKGWAAALCVLLVAADAFAILPGGSKKGIDWKVWNPQAVEQERKNGHPVLVDFTAKSCLTCQVNKGTSLEIDQTRAMLKDLGAVAFEADYTYQNPEIKSELERHNSPGVPLVLVYSKDVTQDPQVLPILLTPAIVSNALARAAADAR